MGNKPPGGGKPKPPPEGGNGGGNEGGSGGGNGQNPPPNGGGNGQNPPSGGGGGGSSPGGGGAGTEGDDCETCGIGPPPGDTGGDPQPAGPSHPFNQLDRDEIKKVVSIIKSRARNEGLKSEIIFASVSMKEPPKQQMLFFLDGNAAKPPRKAWSVFSEDGVNAAYEAIVNLDSGQVESWIKLPPGTQPSFNTDDPLVIQDIIRKDPQVVQRANKAGVTNMEYLICDAWSYGYNDTTVDAQNLRLMDMYLYARKYENDNQYAHPLDFLVTVDMITKKVIDIVDLPVCPGREPAASERPIPPPEPSANYDPRALPKGYYRRDVKPLEVVQPKGPSFTIDGNKITWQRWEMIIGFNFREGLTFHNMSFTDGERKRPVLYRAAISEMVVPYGDPRTPYYRKSAFDLGEYGLGYNANPLGAGCDCLGEIRFMDAVLANSKGEPFVIKNAVCIHEEDAGLLQKHTEFRNGNVTIARSRRLLISFKATVTNYDYIYHWVFAQDGTMHCDIQATGLLSVHQLGPSPNCTPGGYGNIMAPRINAQYHQHIFCARLDTMIDGPNNTVSVQEVIPLQGDVGSAENPYGMGFTSTNRVLRTAGEAGTDTDPNKVRSWLVMNEGSIHPYTNRPVAWKLMAPGFARILAGKNSGVYKRAGFARHSVWVTPFNDEQLYAAGKYINQAKGGVDGVDVWAAKNENIQNTDIVVWHTFGLTHIPRVEDYPLMPVEGASFMFRPSNFFTQNPALDVPPPKKKN